MKLHNKKALLRKKLHQQMLKIENQFLLLHF